MAVDSALVASGTRESAPALSPALSMEWVRLHARMILGCLVAVSAAARSVAALGHAAPAYFPDEYFYAAISRSLAAHGRPLVRGVAAHFPGLLEPLLAAPLWAVTSVGTAYRLVQIENALFMSLAAVPVYMLARRLDFGEVYALVCAAFAVALPDLGFSAYILSDPLGYPLALSALAAAVVALQSRSLRAQIAFVVLAALATLTRLEYVVLAPAFVIASVVVEGRGFLRAQKLVLAAFGIAAGVLLAAGAGRILGYYADVRDMRLTGAFFHWLGLDLFLLALSSGVAVVPGAVVGLVFARGRQERAFAALVLPFAVGLMVETALSASWDPSYLERYLFVLIPLLPLGFGLHLRRRDRGRVAVIAIAATIAAVVARLPLAGYAAGATLSHSPFLWCYAEVEQRVGAAAGSLLFALGASGAAVLAAAALWTRLRFVPLAVAFALVAALSAGAVVYDRGYSREIRGALVAPDPSWVDASGLGAVSAVETSDAPKGTLEEQLFWNRSIANELLLGAGTPASDSFAAERLAVGRDGRLLAGGTAVRNALLVEGYAVTAVLRGAVTADTYAFFTLWRPKGTPRLAVLENGRYWDGWLAGRGRLEAWPAAGGGGTVSFTLSLPRTAPAPVEIAFGGRRYHIVAGARETVVFRLHDRTPRSIPFRTLSGERVLEDLRFVGVRSSVPVVAPATAPHPSIQWFAGSGRVKPSIAAADSRER